MGEERDEGFEGAPEDVVTNVPLMVGGFPAKMYLLDINPDRLISGEKQPVGVKFQPLKKGFGFPKPLLF